MQRHNDRMRWLWRDSTWIFLAAASWFVAENRYFGWHWLPQSEAELLADFGVYLLVVKAFTVRSLERGS